MAVLPGEDSHRRPTFEVDQPLFTAEHIPNNGDLRSVGELLADVDQHARQILMDVTGDHAAGLLRAWSPVVDATARLWRALPGRPHDAELAAELDHPIVRLVAAAARVDGMVQAKGWPGPGQVDARAAVILANLDHAAGLVERYADHVRPEHAPVRSDVDSARSRLMHGLYLTVHATAVALQDRGRDVRGDAIAAGRPIPAATYNAPHTVNGTKTLLVYLNQCEHVVGRYVGTHLPHRTGGDRRVESASSDPDRLERALASFDVHAHRVLAVRPTSANLALVCTVEAYIANAQADIGSRPETVIPGTSVQPHHSDVMSAAQDWSRLSHLWRDISSPTSPMDRTLVTAAGEVRAACEDALWVSATSGRDPRLASRTAAALSWALGEAPQLAQRVLDIADGGDLVGPARALSRRSHDEVERAVEAGAHSDVDRVWVTPQDVAANRTVPLPAPILDALRQASSETLHHATVVPIAPGSSGVRHENPLEAGDARTRQAPISSWRMAEPGRPRHGMSR